MMVANSKIKVDLKYNINDKPKEVKKDEKKDKQNN